VELFEQMMIRIGLVLKAKAKFLELDVDKSGFIEKSEIDAMLSWVLESHVDKTEEQKQNFKGHLLDKIDVNKDGKLDLQEFTDLFGEMLDRYLTNSSPHCSPSSPWPSAFSYPISPLGLPFCVCMFLLCMYFDLVLEWSLSSRPKKCSGN
jgi:hypothetical protein